MSSTPLVLDLENAAGARNQPKVLFAGDAYQGQPYVYVDGDQIILVGDKTNVINVSPDFGVLLSGKISFSAMPDQIALGGGYFRFNPMLTSLVPSTTPTPIPTLVAATPDLLRSASAISDCESMLLQYSDLA
jgi:hypothetical protein